MQRWLRVDIEIVLKDWSNSLYDFRKFSLGLLLGVLNSRILTLRIRSTEYKDSECRVRKFEMQELERDIPRHINIVLKRQL